RQLTPQADERDRLRYLRLLAPVLATLLWVAAAQAATPPPGTGSGTGVSTTTTGGMGIGAPPTPVNTPQRPTVRGAKAKIIKGLAYAPSYAPMQVKKIIWAGDRIRRKPYIYGGGHGVWNDAGYDCSGSVSYVLHAAGLLKVSMDSSQ